MIFTGWFFTAWRMRHKTLFFIRSQFCFYVLIRPNWYLAPVVGKPITANPRLGRPKPRSKFILRLSCVPRSSISTIQGLNWGLNLTHLSRWINSLIKWKSSQTNQNGGLTLCWFYFNCEPGEERKAIQVAWPFFRINFDLTILSGTSHSAFGFPALFRVFTSRADCCLAIRTWNVLHDEGEASRCNVKGKIIGGIKGFLASKASIYRQTIVQVSFTVHLASSWKSFFYLIRRIKITNLRFRFFA